MNRSVRVLRQSEKSAHPYRLAIRDACEFHATPRIISKTYWVTNITDAVTGYSPVQVVAVEREKSLGDVARFLFRGPSRFVTT